MYKEDLKRICDIDNQIAGLRDERAALATNLEKVFFAHSQWPVFLTRHGVKEFSKDMGGRQHCFFCFDGEGCRIRMTDTFHGEIVRDETSSRFSIDEICSFLSDTEYYTPLLKRAEAIRKAKEKRAAEEEERTEYALYRRLKTKFEG